MCLVWFSEERAAISLNIIYFGVTKANDLNLEEHRPDIPRAHLGSFQAPPKAAVILRG